MAVHLNSGVLDEMKSQLHDTGKKKKKKGSSKKNGFSLFMEERKSDIVGRGHELRRGKHDLAQLVADDWNALSDEEKASYNMRAKQFNETERSDASKQKSFTNEDTDKLESEKRAKMEARMKVVDIFEDEKWEDQPIVVCSVNVYYDPDDPDYEGNVYLPAELGLTAMSLTHGVIGNFARIIDPGRDAIPTVYKEDVERMIKKLGIPELGSVPEFADYEWLLADIEKFLRKYQGKETGEFVVFALKSEIVAVQGCFDWLVNKIENRFSVTVLSLDQYGYIASSLKTRLVRSSDGEDGRNNGSESTRSIIATISPHRVVGVPLITAHKYLNEYPMTAFGLFIRESDVSNVMNEVDNLKYFEELCCVYHVKNHQMHHCALNNSNRYSYILLDILTIGHNVPIICGGHFPEVDQPDEEKRRRALWLEESGITNYEKELMAAGK